MFLVYVGDHRARRYQTLVICLGKWLYKIVFFPGRKILHLLPCAVDELSIVKNENQTGSPAALSYQQLLIGYA